MILTEMFELFIDSRKRGMTGAKKKCSKATIEVYERNLNLFGQFLMSGSDRGPVTQYQNIKRLNISDFLDWMDHKEKAKEWSRATVLQALRTIRTFFRWVDQDEDCRAQGLAGLQKYLPSIEKTPRRIDIPQTVDLKRFKNSFATDTKIGFRNYVATCLMLTNGIRIGEVCNLRIDHVLLPEKLMIVDGKQGPRPVPITNDLVRLLKAWYKRRQEFKTAVDSPLVFVSIDKPYMNKDSFVSAFAKHRKKHKLPRITAHTFRHVFSTNFLKQGGDMEKLRLITGHTSYDMLMDYLHLSKIGGKSMQDELEKVNILKEI